MMSSMAFAGLLSEEEMLARTDGEGRRYGDELARLAPAAMISVPCAGGISHSEAESAPAAGSRSRRAECCRVRR